MENKENVIRDVAMMLTFIDIQKNHSDNLQTHSNASAALKSYAEYLNLCEEEYDSFIQQRDQK
jgi:hypothetical protein